MGWIDWIKKNRKLGKCIICGKKRITKLHCQKHRLAQNKINREYRDRRIIRDVREFHDKAA